MESNSFGRCSAIVPIAAIVASISASGCLTTTAGQVAVEMEPPPGQGAASDRSGDFERALSLAAQERHAEAREVLDSLLKGAPDHARARVLHGVLRAREGRVGDAIEVFERLARDHPEMSEPYNNLAVLYTVKGRLDDARKILLESLEHRPNAVTYSNLADVYTKLAEEASEQARRLDAGAVATLHRRSAPVPAVSEPSAGPAHLEPRPNRTTPPGN